MSDNDKKDPLGEILGDELGEWDKMFDSLHEESTGLGDDPQPDVLASDDEVARPEDPLAAQALALELPAAELPVEPSAVEDELMLGQAGRVARTEPEPRAPVEAFDLGPSGAVGFEERSAPVGEIRPPAHDEFSDAPATTLDTGASLLIGTSSDYTEAPTPESEEEQPFQDADHDFDLEPEALGSLLGGAPVEEIGDVISSAHVPPTPAEVREGRASLSRQRAAGPEDAALDDFGVSDGAVSEATLTRVSESAAAFFEDEQSVDQPTELTLELDDDFYDGIQIGAADEATPTPEPAAVPKAAAKPRPGLAHVVRRSSVAGLQEGSGLQHQEVTAVRPNPLAQEETTSVRRVAVPAEARRAETDEPLDFSGPPPSDEIDAIDESVSLEAISADSSGATESRPGTSDGTPVALVAPEPSGFGVLRSGLVRSESEDSAELQHEVDHALDELHGVPEPTVAVPTPEPEGVIRDRAPELDGVVEAAVEDAVAMSTGTLHTGPHLQEADVEPDLPPGRFESEPPPLDLNSIQVPAEVELDTVDRTESMAKRLVLYERELELLDEVGPTIRIRIEAGRLAEALGDLDEARMHLDEALKLDPRLVPANRALRRIERVLGNWDEVLNQLDKELARASPMEARALASYRADLLMATGELDLARVAVGELLDAAPSDSRSLLANLELAFVDGRDEEIESTLSALAGALADEKLTSAVKNIAGGLAERAGQHDKARVLFEEAATLSPGLGLSLAQVSAAAQSQSPETATAALRSAARHCDGLLRSVLQWQEAEALLRAGSHVEALESLEEAIRSDPESLLLKQLMVRASASDKSVSRLAWLALAELTSDSTWLSHCLSRAARQGDAESALAPLARAVEASPADAFLRSELRRAQLQAGQLDEVYRSDESDRSRAATDPLRAYRSAQSALHLGLAEEAQAALTPLLEAGQLQNTLGVLALELAYASGDQALLSRHHTAQASTAGNASEAEQSLRAGSRAMTRIAMANPEDSSLLRQACESWRTQAEAEGGKSPAADLAVSMASFLGDADLVAEYADLAESQSTDVNRCAQLVLEKTGRTLKDDTRESSEGLRALISEQPSPRPVELYWAASLASDDWAAAAEAFESEAQRCEGDEIATADRYLYRAAFMRLQRGIEVEVAAASLQTLTERRDSFTAASELLSGAVSDGSAVSAGAGGSAVTVEQDDLTAAVRQAEALARGGDLSGAADSFANLRKQYPDDALVVRGFERACWLAGASAHLAEVALTALRAAEESADGEAKADACSELARIDGELRGDSDSALMFWESAGKAAPARADLQRILEREYGAKEGPRSESTRTVLGRVVATLDAGTERSAYLVERASLGSALGMSEGEVSGEYQQAFEDDPLCRQALFFLEARASAAGPSEELAGLEGMAANYFSDDPRARAAFQVRSGETWRSLGQTSHALARFKSAVQGMPGFAPALFAWRDLALDHELWEELAEACLLEAQGVDNDRARVDLFLLAGVTLMDKAKESERAIDALRKVLVVDPAHRDAFVRLRILLSQGDRDQSDWAEELAQLMSMRLQVETDEVAQCELHHALAKLLREELNGGAQAMGHLREVLKLRPNDKRAVIGVSELAWDLELWAEAAESLMLRARLETDPAIVKDIFSRLGTIYAEHLPEPKWALKSFRKVVTIDPTDQPALEMLATLGTQTGDYKLALGACEQLIKQDPPVAKKIDYLHRMAVIFVDGYEDAARAERALRVALDLDPSSDRAFDALIEFYVGRNDTRSARVHVDRVAATMRTRLQQNMSDVAAYRVIARAMDARDKAGVKGSKSVAQMAAGVAILLGDQGDACKTLAAGAPVPAATGLGGQDFDDLLFPAAAKNAARSLFSLLGDRLAKHVGIDVRNHGVGRSDRLRKGSDPVAAAILELGAEMGLEDVDIYVSEQQPFVVAAEPTNPPSIILGKNLVSLDRPQELRFLVGRCLKFASADLAVPVQLGVDKFGTLLVGLLRQFQPEFAPPGVDNEAASAEQQRLRRLIPSGMLQELSPYALGLASSDFDHRAIWLALVDAGNRAGLVCAGKPSAGISALMRKNEHRDIHEALQDPEIQELVRFGCSEDHARLWAAIQGL